MTPDETLAAIAAAVQGAGEADDVLREAVSLLAGDDGYAAIAFVEDGALQVGPSAGAPQEALSSPIRFQGALVAELRVAPPAEPAFLERAGELLALHCLVGWDTGGEPWRP